MGFDDDDDDIGDKESSRKRKTPFSSSVNEDIEDEDAMDDVEGEDEEDDEDNEPQEDRPSRYRRRVANFIDEEVSVEDDEVEEDDEYEDAEFSEDDLLPTVAEAPARPSHYRRYEATRDLPEDDEQLEAYLKERYQTVEYTSDATAVNQQSLVPTHLDPKLWVLQCRPGFERSLCLQLLNKHHTFRKKNTPLSIKSAICLNHLKGYFYVEADKESHVREAVQGMRYVQHAKGIKLVPLQEMVAAVTPNRVAKLPIEEGTWVRVRNGPYARDLAKVSQVHHAQQKVELKIIPRIDYQDLLNRQEGRYMNRSRDPFGKKDKIRPVAKPFSSEECRSLGLIVERRRGADGEVYMSVGNYLFQGGYLIKTMSMSSVIVEDSVLPIEELRKFEAAAQMGSDRNAAQEGLPEMLESVSGKKSGLFKGDTVRVAGGDMMSMTGVVSDIAADGKIYVKMDSHDIKGAIPFNATDLVKRFDLGDHVCVREGMRRGQLGMVIKTEAAKCLILSDMDKSEFWASAKDLSKTQDISVGYDRCGDYEVEDLVELQHHQFGLIVFADRDFCTVLLAAGSPEKPELKRATQQEIKCKCDAGRNATNDTHGNRVMARDIVDFSMGVSSAKTSGTVKYVSPPYLFVKVRGRTENLGYVAISSKHCMVRGGQRSAAVAQRHDGPSASFSNYSSAGRQGFSDAGGYSSFGGRGSRGRFFLRGRGRGRHRESVMVKVIKGGHRGFRGRIKDETATHVRVELDAGSKIITIPKDSVEALPSAQNTYTSSQTASTSWNVDADNNSYYPGPPKTPYGDNHPPTTPYSSTNREGLTSPRYTPAGATPAAAETHEQTQDSDSDDDMRFSEGEAVALPPSMQQQTKDKAPEQHADPPEGDKEKEQEVEEEGSSSGSGAKADLSALPIAQKLNLIVTTKAGSPTGVTRDVSENGLCQIEIVKIEEGSEERSFHPTGEKQRLELKVLQLMPPRNGDWVRVLDGMFVDSIAQVVSVEGNDFITRLKKDGVIQIFPGHNIAVTLAPE